MRFVCCRFYMCLCVWILLHLYQCTYIYAYDCRRWDVRKYDKPEVTLELRKHEDSITGISISPDGNSLLTNGMDSRLLRWDTRPFVQDKNNRCVTTYAGVHHGAEKVLLKCNWSPNGDKVTCGSADRIVHIWDSDTGTQQYYLPGHKGSVNDVIFHPTEPIIASCSTDKTIYIGELS